MADSVHKSAYAEKKARGNQMYGPGCCAHRISLTQLADNRRRVAMERKHPVDEMPATMWSGE